MPNYSLFQVFLFAWPFRSDPVRGCTTTTGEKGSTAQRRALATTPEGAGRAGVASGIRVVVVAGA